MRFPEHMCNTALTVKITSGIDDAGVPIPVKEWSGKCFYREVAVNIFAKDSSQASLASLAIISGDIYPEVQKLEGSVSLGEGYEYKIARASRPRGPGGEVLYTRLELS